MNSLIGYLRKVKDLRHESGKRHELWFILLIVIVGLMLGYLGYRALGGFAKCYRLSLCKCFQIPRQQVPSYSTIRRAMMSVDWSDLMAIFNQWAMQLTSSELASDWWAIDGKSLKSTVSNYDNKQQNFVALISVFSATTGLVIALKRFENKQQSEIHACQDLLSTIPGDNKVFTFDALHCQTATIQQIVTRNHQYLVAVKKNQPRLHKALSTQAVVSSPLSQYLDEDTSHGRQVIRQVSVFPIPENLDTAWSSARQFLQVHRRGIRNQKPFQQTVYYLTSCQEPAQVFAQKVQGHWGIENQLHWVKDVIFSEDNSPLRQFQPVTNFSILQTIALNLFRFLGFLSITDGRRWLGHRFWRLRVLLE